MGSLRQAVESTFAGVAYAERNMDGEAKRILEEDGEDSQPRKRAERQMAGQACRQRVRAE